MLSFHRDRYDLTDPDQSAELRTDLVPQHVWTNFAVSVERLKARPADLRREGRDPERTRKYALQALERVVRPIDIDSVMRQLTVGAAELQGVVVEAPSLRFTDRSGKPVDVLGVYPEVIR